MVLKAKPLGGGGDGDSPVMNEINGAAEMAPWVKHISFNVQNPSKTRHSNLNLQSHGPLLLW